MECSDCSSDTDTANSKKRYKCTEKGCNSSFSKNYKLILHIRKHTGERPFICNEAGCGKTYTNPSHLRRHKKISHEEKETQSVMCQYETCGLVFANKYSLKKHYNRKHNLDNYEFICTECSQGFHRKSQLQQHSYLHTGEAPFRCNDCEMAFTTNHNLNKHKRSHRTYKCDCGEIFSKWSLLVTHRKLCKKTKFQCQICDKEFSHLGNYKNHQLVHKQMSEKSVYTCPYANCKRFYFYKKNLKYHINNFHENINKNKVYHCTYPKCKMILKTKQSLKMHLQKHFQWVQKKARKARCDKGKPKKSMAAILTGETEIIQEYSNDLLDGNKESKNVNPEDNLHCNSQEIEDEILKQCEISLTLLSEKILTVS